jgi:hypothetical protein
MPADPPSLERPRHVAEEEAREYAMYALALSCGAGGLAHQVRNPLNAMVLQLALVAEKLSANSELASSCGGNLSKLRQQIGRVEDVLREYLDLAEPAAGPDLEAGRLVAGVAGLLAHEARRCRITLRSAASPARFSAAADGPRIQRIWTGMVWRALMETEDGGTVQLGSAPDGRAVVLAIDRPNGAPQPRLLWIREAAEEAARAMGGRLCEEEREARVRVELRLPGEER